MSKKASPVDHWVKEIAPSSTLRKWFGHRPERWAEFQKRYRSELSKKQELIELLQQLEREHGTVTLLFGTRDEEHNQAVVLRDLLRRKRG